MNKLSSESRLTHVVNSEFAVSCHDDVPLMLFFDRYHLQETRFSVIEVIRKAGVIEQKRQSRKKKEKKKKRSI